jgi:uncharacterized membrane protein
MNQIINFFVTQFGRLFAWMFGTRNGLIFMAAVTFIIVMKFQPELLVNLLSSLIAGTLNLIVRIIEANSQAIQYLFCIALLCFGIVLMFRSVFGKRGGTATKK